MVSWGVDWNLGVGLGARSYSIIFSDFLAENMELLDFFFFLFFFFTLIHNKESWTGLGFEFEWARPAEVRLALEYVTCTRSSELSLDFLGSSGFGSARGLVVSI